MYAKIIKSIAYINFSAPNKPSFKHYYASINLGINVLNNQDYFPKNGLIPFLN